MLAGKPTGFLQARSFVGELVAPYVSQTRRQQLAEITAKQERGDASDAEKEALHGFVLASCGTCLAVGGSLFYAPLYAPSLLIIGYLFKDAFKDTYQALVEERRMGIEMLVVVELLAALLGGFFVTLTVGFCFLRLMKLLLTKIQDNSRKSLVNLFGQQPRFVWVLVDSADSEGKEEVEIPFEDLKAGDLVVVP